MRRIKPMDHPLAAWLPGAGILLALAAASTSDALAPGGAFPRPLEMIGLLVLGTLAALHRPLPHQAAAGGGTLGLAALILPTALIDLGPLPAALLAGTVVLAADAWHGLALTGAARPSLGGRLEDATFNAGAVILAGAVGASWLAEAPVSGWRAAAPAATYIAGLLLLRGVRGVRGRPAVKHGRWSDRLVGVSAPVALDAAGWVIGTLLYDAAVRGSRGRVGALAAIVALLAAEAARGARGRRNAERRLADLERLQHAHRRLLTETSGMGEIAQQIFTECRNVLPVQWFHFELLAPPEGEPYSWAAGPEAVVLEGEPRPPARPRALPGVHRRVTWRLIERVLEVDDEAGRLSELAAVRLWCDPRRIEPGAEKLLSALVPHMASSVHRAQLDREAKIDPLTGVPVRRLLESRLQQAYRLSCEEGWPMAVILCDIDHFKKINDTYGHAAGDEALKLFARTLDAHRRENDLCCRYGGEEFTLLLENTAGDAALNLAERLRRKVAALELELEGESVRLTFSAGVAAFPELYIKTASELLLLADEALYEAKEQGRNRCLLNVGRGGFRAPAGRTFRARETPPRPATPRFFD